MTISLVIFIFLICISILFLINLISCNKYEYSFFNKSSFYLIFILTIIYYIVNRELKDNYNFYSLSMLTYSLITLCVIIIFYLFYKNIRGSSYILGILGTIFQLLLFTFVSYQSIPFLFMMLIASFFSITEYEKKIKIYYH